MALYQIIQSPPILGVVLKHKNPEVVYNPKWEVVGQSVDKVAITESVPFLSIGLCIGEGEIRLYGSSLSKIPCYHLLINEHPCYVPKQCVRIISEVDG